MPIFAIIGSAVASALLGKVFSKAIETKDQTTPDNDTFQLAVDQSSSKLTMDGTKKAEVSSLDDLDNDRDSKRAKSESVTGAPMLAAALDNQFNQSRINKSSTEGPSTSEDGLAGLVASLSENSSKTPSLLQRFFDTFSAVNTVDNRKDLNMDAIGQEYFMGKASTSSTAIAGSSAADAPPNTAASISSNSKGVAEKNMDGTVTLEEILADQAANESRSPDNPILKIVAHLNASYGIDSTQSAPSKSVSTSA